MSPSVHYHRWHYLHLDILAVVALAAGGWFLWPDVPPRSSHPGRFPEPSVAYGYIDPDTVGSVLYPGHFAFSTPIGFGAMGDFRDSADSRWSLAGVRPFTPPIPHTRLQDYPPPPRSTELPVPPSPPDVPVLRSRPSEIRWDVTSADAIRERNLTVPSPHPSAMPLSMPSGDLLAHVRIGADGRVEHVLFPAPDGWSWHHLAVLERLLLSGRAERGPVPVEGWIRIRWQYPPQT